MTDWFERHAVDLARASREAILERLSVDGIITLEGIDDEAEALRVARRFGTIRVHRDSASNGVTHLVASEQQLEAPGLRGFSQDGLCVHTDRTVAESPPTCLFFWCEVPAEQGGETLLVDGRDVYEKTSLYHPEVFDAVTRPRSAVFASDEAFYCGAIYERVTPERVSVRFRYDELFFMAPPLAQAIPVFRGFIDASTVSFKLGHGQGYILQNTRWLHGRRAFRGSRRCGRLHVDPPARDLSPLQGFLPCAA
jgi:alpha-ketoglutarate-dependent taurine dioxygenase